MIGLISILIIKNKDVFLILIEIKNEKNNLFLIIKDKRDLSPYFLIFFNFIFNKKSYY